MFVPVGPTRVVAAQTLMQVITTAGLTTNLKLALDAGDVTSYPGNSQRWRDTSGGGFNFFLGADGTVSSTDPTFHGNVGAQSGNEYFSTDGGDYFTYDTSNAQWMKDIGKPGSMSALAVVYIPSDADLPMFSTEGTTSGFSFLYEAATRNKIALEAWNGTNQTIFANAGPDLSGSVPGLFIVGASLTLAGDGTFNYVIHVNGTNYTSAAVSVPWSSTDPTNVAKLFARGDLGTFSPNGARLYGLALWQGTQLSTANYTTLWNALRGRFGL